ncbi:MAG TPA: hypothetical protein VKX16_10570 [Chloroflexota bacterium]|nr:hypothetical protein [Chloroflexota bacterium]
MTVNQQTRIPSQDGASAWKRRAAVASLAAALLVVLVPSQSLAVHPLSNAYCSSPGAGSDDTCYGTNALASENGGYANSAFGVAALGSNTTGTDNTAAGYGALTNSNGNNNTAAGFTALNGNTTGYNNTADGYEAMRYSSTGHENVADGSQALYVNSTGYYDTAVGTNSLISNTTGHDDTAIGDTALYSNTTGIQNTVLGSYAGANGGNGNTTGSDNTFLGYSAGAASSTQLNNATAIGANATVGESNALVLGGTGSNAVSVGIGTQSPASLFQVGQAGTSYGSYLQLPLVTNTSAPPATDCNGSSFVGRLVLQFGAKNKMTFWACSSGGKWIAVK